MPPQEIDGVTYFDARGLHGWLKISTPLHKWFGRRVDEYGFDDGIDFRPVLVKTGGRPRADYLITSDMAKELSMVERTERGRQTRRCRP
jgi:phage anti-repressor protein